MIPLLVLAISVLVGAIAVYFAARGYSQQGTVQSAMNTISILQDQVKALDAKIVLLNAENVALRQTVDVLREQVTQAAPVRELTDYVKEIVTVGALKRQADHEENLLALARIENAVAEVRSEQRILRTNNRSMSGEPGLEIPQPE